MYPFKNIILFVFVASKKQCIGRKISTGILPITGFFVALCSTNRVANC